MQLKSILFEIVKDSEYLHDPEQVRFDPESKGIPKWQNEFEMFAQPNVISDFDLKPRLGNMKGGKGHKRNRLFLLTHLIIMLDALTGWTLNTHGIDVYSEFKEKAQDNLISLLRGQDKRNETTTLLNRLEKGQTVNIGDLKVKIPNIDEIMTEGRIFDYFKSKISGYFKKIASKIDFDSKGKIKNAAETYTNLKNFMERKLKPHAVELSLKWEDNNFTGTLEFGPFLIKKV